MHVYMHIYIYIYTPYIYTYKYGTPATKSLPFEMLKEFGKG